MPEGAEYSIALIGLITMQRRQLMVAGYKLQVASWDPLYSQPATRNPQPATRNPQPATRNPQLVTSPGQVPGPAVIKCTRTKVSIVATLIVTIAKIS
jgi:hypothetical protein